MPSINPPMPLSSKCRGVESAAARRREAKAET
jgi:hypothetical protein